MSDYSDYEETVLLLWTVILFVLSFYVCVESKSVFTRLAGWSGVSFGVALGISRIIALSS